MISESPLGANTLASAGPSHRKTHQNCKSLATSELLSPNRNPTKIKCVIQPPNVTWISTTMQRDAPNVQFYKYWN